MAKKNTLSDKDKSQLKEINERLREDTDTEETKKEIFYYKNGNKKREYYHKDGEFHREDWQGPAIIDYYDNGNVRKEEYKFNNQFHRTNGPQIIRYNKDGAKYLEKYVNENGDLDRMFNKPAEIWYYGNGKKMSECYCRDGKPHRDLDNGPAHVRYDEDGNIIHQEYLLYGKKFIKKESIFTRLFKRLFRFK